MPRAVRPLRDLTFVFIAGVLLALPYHFDCLGFLGFIAFLPYFFAIANKSPVRVFKYSYFFGIVFFSLLGYWINYVNVLGYIVLALYLALYFGLFGYLAAPFLSPATESPGLQRRRNLTSLLYVPAFWVLTEVVRGWMFGGLPWALLSYSQWKNIWFIQAADLIGSYGISYAVLLINLIFYRILQVVPSRKQQVLIGSEETQGRKKYLWYLIACLAAVNLLFYGYGLHSLAVRDAYYKNPAGKAVLRVSVIQGNIPQEQKWDWRIKSIIIEKYKRLTLMAATEKPDLIVWPETAFPGYIEDEPVMASGLRNLIRNTRTWVLVGAPTYGNLDEGLVFYNSALLFNNAGEEERRYHKVHLVPFGEYIPLEMLVGFIRNFFAIGHFSSGKEKTVFKARTVYEPINFSYKFSALICFEDIFPDLVRRFCLKGAELLVNMSNDAWFGNTRAPYQHAQASVFRAVENRVNVIRATNTGYSCFISPEGRICASVNEKGREIMVTGYKTFPMILRKSNSFYTRYGDVFLIFALVMGVLAVRQNMTRNKYTRL